MLCFYVNKQEVGRNFIVMDMFMALIVVMVSWMYPYL